MNVMAPPWRYPGVQNKRLSTAGSPPAAMRLTRQEQMVHITSPTRKSDADYNNDIDVEEEAAAAIAAGLDFADDDDNGAAIDVEKLGMTNERQKEIQGSLFKMLGAEDKKAPQQRRGGQVSVGDVGAIDDSSADATPGDEDILVNSSG